MSLQTFKVLNLKCLLSLTRKCFVMATLIVENNKRNQPGEEKDSGDVASVKCVDRVPIAWKGITSLHRHSDEKG